MILLLQYPATWQGIHFHSSLIHVLYCGIPKFQNNQIHLATEENIACGLSYWARLFKAQTWEGLQMLASEYEVFENITDTMQKALADKKIRMECEARERYERDRTSLYNSGRREGQAEARKESIGKTIKIMKDLNTSKETAIIQIMKHYALSEKEATDVVNSLWE